MSEEARTSQLYTEVAWEYQPLVKCSQVVIEVFYVQGFALTWQDNSENADSLHLERSIDGASYVEIEQFDPGTEKYSDMTVGPGHTYRYRIRAYDDVLGYSHYSNIAEITV